MSTLSDAYRDKIIKETRTKCLGEREDPKEEAEVSDHTCWIIGTDSMDAGCRVCGKPVGPEHLVGMTPSDQDRADARCVMGVAWYEMTGKEETDRKTIQSVVACLRAVQRAIREEERDG